MFATDGLHTAALLNWVQGLYSSGTKKQPVPGLMGANYQVRNQDGPTLFKIAIAASSLSFNVSAVHKMGP